MAHKLFLTEDCSRCAIGGLDRWDQSVGDGEYIPVVDKTARWPKGITFGPWVTDGQWRFAALWCLPPASRCLTAADGAASDRGLALSDDGGVSLRLAAERYPAGACHAG